MLSFYHTASLARNDATSTSVVCVQFSQLVDGSIELLAERCPHLETLDISHCPSLSGASITTISKVSTAGLMYSTAQKKS